MHAIADIDINVPQIARDFRMYFHHLVGLKLPSQAQNMGKIATLHNGDSG
jgi:hypothetical protein